MTLTPGSVVLDITTSTTISSDLLGSTARFFFTLSKKGKDEDLDLGEYLFYSCLRWA